MFAHACCAFRGEVCAHAVGDGKGDAEGVVDGVPARAGAGGSGADDEVAGRQSAAEPELAKVVTDGLLGDVEEGGEVGLGEVDVGFGGVDGDGSGEAGVDGVVVHGLGSVWYICRLCNVIFGVFLVCPSR